MKYAMILAGVLLVAPASADTQCRRVWDSVSQSYVTVCVEPDRDVSCRRVWDSQSQTYITVCE